MSFLHRRSNVTAKRESKAASAAALAAEENFASTNPLIAQRKALPTALKAERAPPAPSLSTATPSTKFVVFPNNETSNEPSTVLSRAHLAPRVAPPRVFLKNTSKSFMESFEDSNAGKDGWKARIDDWPGAVRYNIVFEKPGHRVAHEIPGIPGYRAFVNPKDDTIVYEPFDETSLRRAHIEWSKQNAERGNADRIKAYKKSVTSLQGLVRPRPGFTGGRKSRRKSKKNRRSRRRR